MALLEAWQAKTNLIAPSTLGDIWRRHVADSAQLVPLGGGARRWIDLGSGAGFPGLVVAILLAERGEGTVTLVESNAKKAAFLRTVIAETGAPAILRHERIESVLKQSLPSVDIVTARALASLDRLCILAAPFVARGARCLFHKGRGFEREIEEAARSWTMDVEKHPSLTEADGRIIEIRALIAHRGTGIPS